MLDGAKILREEWLENDTKNTLVPLYDNEDAVCGIEYNGEPYYFQKNLQGDVIAIVDKQSEEVVRYTYDAWGKVTQITGDHLELAITNPFRYRGYYFDQDSGTYYLQSRYYDPQTGRFVNGDDVELLIAIQEVNEYNCFTYCLNNPINASDFLGYLTFKADWFGFALDVAFTIICNWVKIGYDIIGIGLKWYAKKKGFTLFFDKLLYGVVPKIRGIFGKFLTLVRKAMWRFAGNVASNFTTSFIGTALSNFISFIHELRRKSNAAKIVQIIFRCLTLGSLIALLLDKFTDGDAFNNKIVL